MQLNQNRVEAGMVYVLALALHRRSPLHPAIKEAFNWLTDAGFDRQAQQLSSATDAITVPRNLRQP